MNEVFVQKREGILFAPSGAAFGANCKSLNHELLAMSRGTEADREMGARIAAEIAIDLRSYLVQWVLAGLIERGELKQSAIDREFEALVGVIRKNGRTDILESAEAEIESIKSSSIRRMCELRLEKKLNTVWGHDYASGLTHSLRRGARWVTSNPCKITLFKKDFPEEFDRIVEDIKKSNPDTTAEEMVSLLFTRVCAISARELRPIYDATHGEYGFVCVQTNPFNIPNPDSADKMVQQVEFWDSAFKKELQTEKPNIVYKIPAVKTGIEAVECLIGKNYRLCLTLNFTVTQHEIFASLLSKGRQRSFVVLMGGLLDDKVTEELAAMGINNAREIGMHAAQAVIRRSYANLKAKGYDDKVSIMTAAVRGPWAIANSLAPADGAPILFTTLTNKINEFDNDPLPLVSEIEKPMRPEIMAVLNTSRVFRQAYCFPEEGLLTWDNIFEFPPFVAFYDQFREAYKELTDYVEQYKI